MIISTCEYVSAKVVLFFISINCFLLKKQCIMALMGQNGKKPVAMSCTSGILINFASSQLMKNID